MQRLMGLIVVGLVLWGVMLAVGAYRFNYNPWRGIIVFASFALFLAWWWWLLRNRQRRMRQ